MSKRAHTTMTALALLIAAAVLAATAAQALRDHSWAPVWAVGWLPAILVAALATPRGRATCRPRPRRRPHL